MKRSYLIALASVIFLVAVLALFAPNQNGGNGWSDLKNQIGAALSAVTAPPAASYPELNVQHNVPVLVLEYFPNQGGVLRRADGGKILDGLDGADAAATKAVTDSINASMLAGLQKGSRYHGASTPGLLYSVADTKVYDKDFPKITATLNTPPTENVAIDYASILKSSGFDICRDYVDNPAKNVRQVWIWTYGSYAQSTEWGFSSNGLDRIGYINAAPSAQRLLPRCQNSYGMLHLNYGRGVGEAIHSEGHLLEAIFSFVDATLFNDKFVGLWKSNPSAPRRCGSVHVPANTSGEYQYMVTASAPSDCSNWNPDGPGTAGAVPVSCRTWSTSPTCQETSRFDISNSQAGYLVYWMQNMPGMGNTLTYQGNKMRNWWEFVADFNAAYARGKSLTYPPTGGNIQVTRISDESSFNPTATSVWMDTVTAPKAITANPAVFSNVSSGPHTVYLSVPKGSKPYSLVYSYCDAKADLTCEDKYTRVSMEKCIAINVGGTVCPIVVDADAMSVWNLKVSYSVDHYKVGDIIRVRGGTTALNEKSEEIGDLPIGTLRKIAKILPSTDPNDGWGYRLGFDFYGSSDGYIEVPSSSEELLYGLYPIYTGSVTPAQLAPLPAPVPVKPVTMLYPNGGEMLYSAYPMVIKWSPNDAKAVSLTVQGVYVNGTIARCVPNTGSYTWQNPSAMIPTSMQIQEQFRVADDCDGSTKVSDKSDGLTWFTSADVEVQEIDQDGQLLGGQIPKIKVDGVAGTTGNPDNVFPNVAVGKHTIQFETFAGRSITARVCTFDQTLKTQDSCFPIDNLPVVNLDNTACSLGFCTLPGGVDVGSIGKSVVFLKYAKPASSAPSPLLSKPVPTPPQPAAQIKKPTATSTPVVPPVIKPAS